MKKILDSRFDFKKYENLIIRRIGFKDFVVSEKDIKRKGKNVFSMIMPPPNANGDVHLGHALFLALQDIIIRYFRNSDYLTLWVPGFDHAGFETQVVLENKLAEEGKSRFDFSQEELFKLTKEFVETNIKKTREEIKRFWVAVDWTKEKFTLDKDVVDFVYYVFTKMYNDGLIYKAYRPVNFCVYHQTGLSDLEVNYKKSKGYLYYVKYQIKGESNYLTVATSRPETIFADVALVVNTKDERYKNFVGKVAFVPILNKEIPVLAHKLVDPEFGTGVLKITPAHDFKDWIIAQDLGIKIFPSVINKNGQINENGLFLNGKTIEQARKEMVKALEKEKLLEKIEEYEQEVPVCYKCGNKIEIIPTEQWFIKMKPLADLALKAIKRNEINFVPSYMKKRLIRWFENIVDWNISRQIAWGISIPSYTCENGHINISVKKINKCNYCKSKKFEKEKSVFDTWFSSSLWPIVVLLLNGRKINKKKKRLPFSSIYFEKFYPTSLMETGYDILYFWVARMIIFGLYLAGKVPFKNVYLHGLAKDEKDVKMSKSKGNVVNPMDVIEKYGIDALRLAMVMNVPPGSDLRFSEEKLIAGRNFTNKIWNIARFIYSNVQEKYFKNNAKLKFKLLTKKDKFILKEEAKALKLYHQYMQSFQVHKALNVIYNYSWRKLADIYIEESKKQLQDPKLKQNTQMILVYLIKNLIKVLHPFLPITTTAISLEIFKTKNFN